VAYKDWVCCSYKVFALYDIGGLLMHS